MLGLGRIGTPQVSNLPFYKSVAADLKFTENKGQWDAKAKFLAQTNQVDYWVTNTGIVYDWHGSDRDVKPASLKRRAEGEETPLPTHTSYTVAVDFVGATGLGKPQGMYPQPGLSNYYFGAVHANRVRSYGSAIIQDLYKGIDLVTYFDEQDKRPRYDLIVHPGADPNQIKMRFNGAKNLKVTRDGSVEYDTPFGKIQEQRQMAYQKADNGPDFRFFPAQVKNEDGTIGFDTRGYQKDRTLVIDPVVYATYIGGTSPNATFGYAARTLAVAVDSSKNMYVTGEANDTGFPTHTTATVHATSGKMSLIAAKFDSTGTCLYSTIYGGADTALTSGRGVGFDSSGNLYAIAYTSSSNIFTTDSQARPFTTSAFLARLDGTGAVTLGRYLRTVANKSASMAIAVSTSGVSTVAYARNSGGTEVEQYGSTGTVSKSYSLAAMNSTNAQLGVALDSSGNIFVAGTASGTKVTLTGGVQKKRTSANTSAVILRIPAGTTSGAIASGTYFGGAGTTEGWSLAIDSHNTVFLSGVQLACTDLALTTGTLRNGALTGDTGFVAAFSDDLTTISAACIFGSADDGTSSPFNNVYMTLDASGNPMIQGVCTGALPLTWDAYSGHFNHEYLAKLSADLTTILYDSYYGDEGGDGIYAIATDSDGKWYLVGGADAIGLPVTANALQSTFDPSSLSVAGFVEVIDPKITPGITRITSDRGALPSVAGGAGKNVTVSVYFNEPDGTHVTLTSQDPAVQVNGGTSASFTSGQFYVLGATHAAPFTITANDVAVPTTVTLLATNDNDGSTMRFPVTVLPFVRNVTVRPGAVAAGDTFTVYVTPQEVPVNDHTINITAGSPNDLAGTPSLVIKGTSSGQSISGATSVLVTAGDFPNTHVGTIVATDADGIGSASSSMQFNSVKISSAVFTRPSILSEDSTSLVVTMTGARTSSQTYTFTSNNPSILGDLQVTVPANQSTGTASILLGAKFGTALTTQVVFSNTLNGVKQSAVLKITLNHLASAGGPSSVVEGDSITFTGSTAVRMFAPETFTATSIYPDSIPAVNLTFSSGSASLSGTVHTNNIGLTAPRMAQVTVQMVSSGAGTGLAKSFNVNVIPLLTSIDLASLTVKGGTDITGTMTLAEANNTSSPSFSLTSSSPVAFFDGTAPATVSTGTATTIPFTIHTQAVTKAAKVVIALPTPLGYRTKQFIVTVTP